MQRIVQHRLAGDGEPCGQFSKRCCCRLDLYEDLGSKQKVFIDLECSSHNAMWGRSRLPLFQASFKWLKEGRVNGTSAGVLKLGY